MKRRGVGIAALGVLLLGFVTRLGHGFEWDELQLLHGAWSIAQGRVPYRDFFEHHPPLMHALVAPLVGGQAEISWRLLIALRVLGLAVLLGSSVCFVRFLRRTTDEGAAWGMIVLLAVSPLAGKLFELRADWPAVLCLLTAMLLVVPERHRAPLPPRRMLAAGLLTGLAVCFTQKALVLAIAMLGWTALSRQHGDRWRIDRGSMERAAALVAGGIVAPVILGATFWLGGALGQLVDSVIGVNLDWPREVGWQRLWQEGSTAAFGPLVLAVASVLRVVRGGIGGERSPDGEELAAFAAVTGVLAFVVTPVPWEQSYLLLVAPWVASLALTTAARYAHAPDELRRDRWLLGGAAVIILATLPGVFAARAVVVWGAAAVAFAWSLSARDARRRLERGLLVLVLPGLVAYTRDRLADVAERRGVAQARFTRAAQAFAPAGSPVLALWDHVLPFHPAASFHWFAHAGVLERFSAGRRGARDLDAEYAEAIERGGVRLVLADDAALAEDLPRLRAALADHCRPVVPGYDGSNAWACRPAPDAGDMVELPPATPPVAAAADAPNVVLIIVDTLRLDHVGCYGYHRPTTPNIDALANGGVLFENPVSQAPWTGASVGSLLTGLHPSVHGLDTGARWDAAGSQGLPFVVQRTLHPSVPTLPHVLREHGYRTAGFVSNVYLNAAFGFARGFDVFEDDHADYSRDVLSRKRRGDETNRRVIRWLETKPPEPFFLMVHYNDPHWPYDPPTPHGAEWIAGYRGPLAPGDTGEVAEREGGRARDLDPESLAYVLGLYDGEVHFADANVGALVDRLRDGGLHRPVLTVLTADHGEEFLDHGGMSHGYTLYDEQLRVPLIVHFPGRLPATRVRPQVRLIDVMPTVLDLTGVGHTAAQTQGVSLEALARGQRRRGPGDALSEAPLRGRLRSLRTDAGWKLVDDAGRARRELFDLVRDPREGVNVAARTPAAADALSRRTGRAVKSNAHQRVALGLDRSAPNEVVVGDALRQRLEALGYMASAP